MPRVEENHDGRRVESDLEDVLRVEVAPEAGPPPVLGPREELEDLPCDDGDQRRGGEAEQDPVHDCVGALAARAPRSNGTGGFLRLTYVIDSGRPNIPLKQLTFNWLIFILRSKLTFTAKDLNLKHFRFRF